MERITLPSGGWVDTRDTLSVDGRAMVQAAATQLAPATVAAIQHVADGADPDSLRLDADETLALLRVQQAVVAAFIVDWSYPEPVSLRAVRNMDPADFDAIAKATAPAGARVLETGAGLDFSPTDDPASPTRPSPASDRRVRAVPSSRRRGSSRPTTPTGTGE